MENWENSRINPSYSSYSQPLSLAAEDSSPYTLQPPVSYLESSFRRLSFQFTFELKMLSDAALALKTRFFFRVTIACFNFCHFDVESFVSSENLIGGISRVTKI